MAGILGSMADRDPSVPAAFASAAAQVEQTLAQVDDWDAPGLGEWSLAELGAHVVRAADLIRRYLAEPVEGGAPVCDRVSYFAFDLRAAAPSIAERSRQEAADIGSERLVEAFADAWRASADVLRAYAPDRLLATFRGPMGLHEYAATRVFELAVHHLDLCRALGRPPHAPDDAMVVVSQVLDGLLDGPRPDDLADDVAFALAATGREPHDDPRLPVLS